MDFVASYAKAETVQDKIKCHIAKCLGAKVVTPMGRILLLPKDYIQKAIETGFDHEIISRGNCMICGKPIDIDNIFLCSDCVKQESNVTKEQREQLDLMRAKAQTNIKLRGKYMKRQTVFDGNGVEVVITESDEQWKDCDSAKVDN